MLGLAIFNTLGHYIAQIPALIFYGLYMLITALANFFIYLPELLFKKVTGTGSSWAINGIEIGGDSGNDIAMAFIRSEQVRATFFTVLGFSIVLLVVFTIIAIIRSEFTTDVSKAAKWPYVQRALKGIMNFVLVPVLSLVFIFGVNFLTRTINNVVGVSGDSTMVRYVIDATLSGAERTDETLFAEYLINDSYRKANINNPQTTIDLYTTGQGVELGYAIISSEEIEITSGNFKYFLKFEKNKTIDAEPKGGYKYDIKNSNDSGYFGTVEVYYFLLNDNTLGEMIGSADITYDLSEKEMCAPAVKEIERDNENQFIGCELSNDRKIELTSWGRLFNTYMEAVDQLNNVPVENIFKDCKTAADVKTIINEMIFQTTAKGINNWNIFKNVKFSGIPDTFTDYNNYDSSGSVYVPYQCMIIKPPTTYEMQNVQSPMFCNKLINFFYNPMHFNLILGGFAACIIAWNLFGVVILLLKRAFELAILFMISPIAVSLYPLDDGEATKGWRKSFQSRVLAPVAIVFSFNIFFVLIELVSYNNVNFAVNAFAIGRLFRLFWNLVIICSMSSLLKAGSSMLCSIIGADDLLKDASATAGKGFSTLAKVAGTTAGVAIGVGGAATKIGQKIGDNVAERKLNRTAEKEMAAYQKRAADRESKKSILDKRLDGMNARNASRSALDEELERMRQDYFRMDDASTGSYEDELRLQDFRERMRAKTEERAALGDMEDTSKIKNAIATISKKIDAENEQDLESVNRADSDRREERETKIENRKKKLEKAKKAGSNVGKKAHNMFNYLTSYMPEDNAAVKWGDSMFGEEGRKQWYKGPAEFKAWKKADDKKKKEKEQRETIEFEQRIKLEQEEKAAKAEREGKMKDKVIWLKANTDKTGANLAELDVLNANFENAKTDSERNAADEALNKFSKKIGADQVLKDLNSKNSAIRSNAEAFVQNDHEYNAAKEVRAFEKNMQEMLPELAKLFKNMDLSQFSDAVKKAITQAMKDINDSKKGYKEFDPITQSLLKAITECQGGLRDLNTTIETLKNINLK